MRVLYLQNYATDAGSQHSLLLLLDCLGDRVQPFVSCGGEGWFTGELRRRGVPFCVSPYPRWSKFAQLGRSLGRARELAATAGVWRAELIHSNEHWMCPHAVLAGRRAGVPAVCHVRDEKLSARRVVEYLFPWAARALPVSRAVGRPLLRCRLTRARTEVVYNGCRLEGFGDDSKRGAVRAGLGYDDSHVVITEVGTVDARKNQAGLIEAMARVRAEAPHARLLLVGSSEAGFLESLRAQAGRLGVSDVVTFAGRRSDVPDVLAATDIFCLPSLREGFARVIVEAMAAGRPVVASDASGNPEAVVDERTGLLYPVGEADALASALLTLVRSPELREEFGRAGRALAAERFSAEAVADRVYSIYGSVLAERRRA